MNKTFRGIILILASIILMGVVVLTDWADFWFCLLSIAAFVFGVISIGIFKPKNKI